LARMGADQREGIRPRFLIRADPRESAADDLLFLPWRSWRPGVRLCTE
jgi:hypothetical protein